MLTRVWSEGAMPHGAHKFGFQQIESKMQANIKLELDKSRCILIQSNTKNNDLNKPYSDKHALQIDQLRR